MDPHASEAPYSSARSAAKHTFSDTLIDLSPLGRLFAILLLATTVISGTILAYDKNHALLKEVPRYGGSHTEGIVGTPRFINPLLAISPADRDLTAVVYAGLMKRSADGTLVPQLAESYKISDDGTVYTFTLRPDLTFQDGTPLTADDVVYTIKEAANPNIRSPLYANWEGVKVDVLDARTVTFTLPQPYAPFIENTTIGILPKHIWAPLADDQFSFSQFNTRPVGAGPYEVTNVVVDKSGIPSRYELRAFDRYVLGKPHIAQLNFALYRDRDSVLQAFTDGRVDAVYNVAPAKMDDLLEANGTPVILRAPLLRVFGVFLNHNKQPVFMDAAVREALDVATPRRSIVGQILGGYGTALDAPVPPNVLAAVRGTSTDSTSTSADMLDSATSTLQRDLSHARSILEGAGWKRGDDGVYTLTKNKDQTTRLAFTLSTVDTPELVQAANMIADSWRQLGAEVDVKVFNATDLTQSVIRPRKYDALLFGMDLGHELDLYAFWHSSQRNDPGLNIAQFADIEADAALDNLRVATSTDAQDKLIGKFLDRVASEHAAISLYAPDFTYVVRDGLRNVTLHPIADASERFDTIDQWYQETDSVWPVVRDLLSRLTY